ncbi:MAG TPA: cell division protein ZapD [Casimicrobiaceae bacterium]|nr:cell division protein ZapD [Casimicrobiaceae bacterium]
MPAETLDGVVRYEHPLNERVRTLMRLEDLFARVRHFTAHDAPFEHHAALVSLFEITDVAARADLKADLVQELERQKQGLAPLRNNPNIDHRALDALLADIDGAASQLLSQQGKAGMHLRDNEWLMAIKQRTGLPGGVAEFDLPAYHYWLNRPPDARRQDLAGWIEPFTPIAAGVAIVLRLLRENGRASAQVAQRGMFQLMLTTTKVAQLLRLTLSRSLACVPEISANKYALNIRFIGVTGMDRGAVYDRDVEFELTFCNL